MHKYHVYNNKHHWPIILSTTTKFREITHSDYSENMSQMQKEEAQLCHFSKTSYSLHCTVEHINREKHPSILSPYCYLYHFSDDMKHDYAFTATVAHTCLALNDLPQIIRQKSNNCGTQYKSRYVFGEYQKMAIQIDQKVIIYYGLSGHGKGLVDAMSAFSMKGPLLKVVVIILNTILQKTFISI